MAKTSEGPAISAEERAIRAAQEYIDKLRSMNPSLAVQRDLDEEEQRLDQRLRQIDERRGQRHAFAS